MRLFSDKNYDEKLIVAIDNENVNKVKSIIAKSNKNKKILNLNLINKNGICPILLAFKKMNIDIFTLLLEYANQNQITLEVIFENELNSYLSTMNYRNSVEIVVILKLLMEYADQHHIILELNKQEKNGWYPLLKAIFNNNIEMVKLLIEYADKHEIVLKLNRREKDGYYPLLSAVSRNNIEIVKLLIEYADKHEMILKLNKKEKDGYYPFLSAVTRNNIEMVKLLIEYADQHEIILELNEKDDSGKSTLLSAASRNNVEMVQLLIEYADKYEMVLELNYKDSDRKHILSKCFSNDGVEMVKLLTEYAIEHKINLLYEKFYIKNNSEINTIIQDYEKVKEKWEKDRIERERIEVERMRSIRIETEIERLKSLRIESEGSDSEGIEKERLERLERERKERERIEKERLERERLERERLEKELERERQERERLEYEKLEREKIERKRLENEKLEKERIERERSLYNNDKNNNDIVFPKTPTLVIATNNFDGEEYDHLDLKKDEFLVVTDWNRKDGWVYGHRKENEKDKGIFPRVFIKVYDEDYEEKSSSKNEITPEYKIKFANKIKELRSLSEMNFKDSSTFFEVNRSNLFDDAFNSIMKKSPKELKRKLEIRYKGEEGIDAGGLLRDFFYQMSKIIGNPSYSLFKYSHDDSYELEINPNSGKVEPNHLKYFRFIGRIIALAVFNKQYLSTTFTLQFYKRLLDKPLEFSDLEYIDPQLYQNLQHLKNNDGAENLYLTFSMDVKDEFGNINTIELKPNGANIDVTDDNKNEYIDLIIENKLVNTNDKEQLEAFKKGFYEIMPKKIGSILDEVDLKYLISGINIIDVDDWENNTDYDGYKKDDETINYFWKCVRKFSDENRTKLLLFATGNSQVPVTGFKDLQGNGNIERFKIKKLGTEKDLPKSHTCFNRIDLPPYTSYIQMKQKLLLAISEGMGGFTME